MSRAVGRQQGGVTPTVLLGEEKTIGEHLLVLRASQRYPATQTRDKARPSQVNG